MNIRVAVPFIRLLVFLCAAAVLTSASTLVDTSGFATPTSINSWGSMFNGTGSTSTYGEIVTVPVGESELTSFTFYVTNSRFNGPLNFMAYVFPFITDQAGGFTLGHVGSALWSSPGTQGDTGSNSVPLTFDPNVSVTAGNTYALVLTTLGVQNSAPATGFAWLAYDASSGRKYSGDAWVGSSDNDANTNTGSIAELQANSGMVAYTSNFVDSVFQAQFDSPGVSTPEPGTIGLLGLGLVFLFRRAARPRM